MITVEELKKEISEIEFPKNWRKGQSVFNYIEYVYGGVARIIQFKYGIDCFYKDDNIDDFLDKVVEIINHGD